jgi:hypothetical protein
MLNPKENLLFSNGPFNYRHKNNRHLIPWSDGQLSNLVIVYSTSHVVLGSQLFDSKECCLNGQKNIHILFWSNVKPEKSFCLHIDHSTTDIKIMCS